VLNLSFNNISRIENLPGTLEELYLNGNKIDHLSVSKPIGGLFHLGLNRNKIRQTALAQIIKAFPNLVCLDLSFNDLCEMDNTITWLKQLPELRMLQLEGNPLFLVANYRRIFVEQMYTIKLLESITVPQDQRRAA
jgi:Leucine-rich repeat (LRR) protein